MARAFLQEPSQKQKPGHERRYEWPKVRRSTSVTFQSNAVTATPTRRSSGYSRRDDWNVYTYECENDTCDPAVTRTLVEVPADLDSFARRDPTWRGGGKHGEEGTGAEED